MQYQIKMRKTLPVRVAYMKYRGTAAGTNKVEG